MAKKRRESAVVVFETYIEYLYQNGILHSFIINSSIILILALIVNSSAIVNKPIVITISDTETKTEFVDDESVFVEMDSVAPEENSSTSNSEIVISTPSDNVEANVDIPELDISTKRQTETIVEHKDLFVDLIKTQTPKTDSRQTSSSSSNKGQSNISGKGEQTLKRLKEAGAQTGDVQVSIAWDNYNDIDLWVVLENQYGEFVINWVNRTGPGNGTLDVDRNVKPTTNQPVENIFWHHGLAPEGKYTVYVQHYWQWDKQDNTPVFLRVLVDGKVTEKMISVSRYQGVKKVYSFYRKEQQKNQNYSPETSGSTGPHFPIGQLWSGQ